MAKIEIHPPREEEIVIEAGSPAVGDAAAGDAIARAESARAATSADAPRAATVTAVAPGPLADPATVAADPATVKGSVPAFSPKPSRKTASDYEETTLEDLQSVKMSTTQKVVIVCAVVGIIVFVIWYLFNYVFI